MRIGDLEEELLALRSVLDQENDPTDLDSPLLYPPPLPTPSLRVSLPLKAHTLTGHLAPFLSRPNFEGGREEEREQAL